MGASSERTIGGEAGRVVGEHIGQLPEGKADRRRKAGTRIDSGGLNADDENMACAIRKEVGQLAD